MHYRCAMAKARCIGRLYWPWKALNINASSQIVIWTITDAWTKMTSRLRAVAVSARVCGEKRSKRPCVTLDDDTLDTYCALPAMGECTGDGTRACTATRVPREHEYSQSKWYSLVASLHPRDEHAALCARAARQTVGAFGRRAPRFATRVGTRNFRRFARRETRGE